MAQQTANEPQILAQKKDSGAESKLPNSATRLAALYEPHDVGRDNRQF